MAMAVALQSGEWQPIYTNINTQEVTGLAGDLLCMKMLGVCLV
jgi:hypothetical protein